MKHTAQSPIEWFAEAARWYVEAHQGCPCCGHQHCVFRSEWGPRIEYYCSLCDFSTCHDRQTGRCYAALGEENARSGDLFADPYLVDAMPAR
jgi:hypothetical protein